MGNKTVSKQIDKLTQKEKKLQDFSDILDNLSSTEDKKKLLWKEVYENALEDRSNAQILFDDLILQSRGNSGNHTVFGPLMSKYLERMAKSNDQILKLAELIAKEEEQQQMTSDDIFNQIEG
jgi:hypothetical protein